MKKILRMMSLLLCIAMVFALGACGKAENTSSVNEDDPILIGFDGVSNVDGTNSEKNESAASNIGINDKTEEYGGTTVSQRVDIKSSDPFANIPERLRGTTVKFATWGDESGEAYRKVFRAFTKKTGIKVQIIEYPQNSYLESVAASVANKSAPDVVVASTFPHVATTLQPLNNIIDLSDDFWDKRSVKYGTVNGKSYLVNSWKSCWQGVQVTFYNKAIFENNGLTSPEDYYKAGKWTYENLEKCAKEVAALGNGIKGVEPRPHFLSMQMGKPVFKYDAGTNMYSGNIKSTVEAYQWFNSLTASGAALNYEDWGIFASGKLGIILSDLYGAKFNGYFKDMKDSELRMIPLPSSINGKPLEQAVTNGLRAYGIAKGAKNPEGAVYFLRYFLDYDYYKQAGAKIFKNDNLEKAYFDTIIPIYKNAKNYVIDPIGDLTSQAGFSFERTLGNDLLKASSGQITTLINSKANMYDNAANQANEIIKQIGK